MSPSVESISFAKKVATDFWYFFSIIEVIVLIEIMKSTVGVTMLV